MELQFRAIMNLNLIRGLRPLLNAQIIATHFDRTDIDRLIAQILLEEPLISEARKPQLKKLIESKFGISRSRA
jgi:hypothetical protein